MPVLWGPYIQIVITFKSLLSCPVLDLSCISCISWFKLRFRGAVRSARSKMHEKKRQEKDSCLQFSPNGRPFKQSLIAFQSLQMSCFKPFVYFVYFVVQIAVLRRSSICTFKMAIAAGVTPGILPAAARSPGRMRVSFSITSRLSPLMAA
jgi:hypothetical protein